MSAPESLRDEVAGALVGPRFVPHGRDESGEWGEHVYVSQQLADARLRRLRAALTQPATDEPRGWRRSLTSHASHERRAGRLSRWSWRRRAGAVARPRGFIYASPDLPPGDLLYRVFFGRADG